MNNNSSHNASAVETAKGVFTAKCPCGWEGVKSWKQSVVESNAWSHKVSEDAKAAQA